MTILFWAAWLLAVYVLGGALYLLWLYALSRSPIVDERDTHPQPPSKESI